MPRSKFSLYLLKNGFTSRTFAERLEEELGHKVSSNTVDNWRIGRAAPRRKVMPAIKKISKNELTFDDFLKVEKKQ